MREMTYRNMSSPDHRQKDLLLSEVREDQGVTTQLEKRYTYRVKSVDPALVPLDAPVVDSAPGVWELRSNPLRSRHIFVRKLRKSQDGVELFVYKIVGSFYATQQARAYLITYRHILHLSVTN